VDCFRNGHLAIKPAEQIQLPKLGQTGQRGVVIPKAECIWNLL
jgi:hypothetical protein